MRPQLIPPIGACLIKDPGRSGQGCPACRQNPAGSGEWWAGQASAELTGRDPPEPLGGGPNGAFPPTPQPFNRALETREPPSAPGRPSPRPPLGFGGGAPGHSNTHPPTDTVRPPLAPPWKALSARAHPPQAGLVPGGEEWAGGEVPRQYQPRY